MGLPGSETIATGPSSGTVSSGVAAVADPMIEMSGQFPALNAEMSQAEVNSAGSAPSTPGRNTTVSWIPASSAVCLIEVVIGGLVEGAVKPRAPIFAENSGENGTAAQFVGVYGGADPVPGVPAYGVAEKVTVLGVHWVGLRLNPLPVPGAVPNSVIVWELMWVGSDASGGGSGVGVVLGMSLMTVSRPKSLVLSLAPDCRITGSSGTATLPPRSPGWRTIANRAGSPGWA